MVNIKELSDRIIESLKDGEILDPTYVVVDDKGYFIEKYEDLPVIDQGKYQTSGSIFSVRRREDNEPLFFIEQDFWRTGSYYSHYEQEYETPYLVFKRKKTIVEFVKYKEEN